MLCTMPWNLLVLTTSSLQLFEGLACIELKKNVQGCFNNYLFWINLVPRESHEPITMTKKKITTAPNSLRMRMAI